ncbi:MAG: hypothetical protein KAG66_23655, partial [Methylococcales bacterium]|nr:hypothetical protein [Methylococcales bacterium]
MDINLSDLEASILKAITPQIEHLRGRPIPDPPKLSEKAAQQRLILTLVNILQRQTQPTLLFLEDLHWASESLIPIQYLARLLTHEQLVVIGTYRDDESPNLPQQIPEAEVLPLARLDKSAIAELSSAMLGDAVGQRAEVVQLLHQETEGNAFFLVEVVRALAEEAGSMADVITMSLPERVLTGGIQKIIRRRLAKVAPHHQPLLKLAAVAGRDIDLTILEQLRINDNTDVCVIAGQEAGVLAVQENLWQFAHDKLRQAVLTDLTVTERLTAHQAVAEAIEQAYPDDPVQASSLAQHWESANHLEKAQRYAFIAGKYAAKQYANEDAIVLLSRAFSLASKGDLRAQYDCLLAREAVNKLLGKRDLQQQDLTRLTALADEMDQPGLQAKVALRQASYLQIVGDFETAVSTARRAVKLAEAANAPLQITA